MLSLYLLLARRFQKRAFEAAEAYELAREGDEEDDEEDEDNDEEEDRVNDGDDDDWEEDIEEEGEGEDIDHEVVLSRLSSLPSESSIPDDGSSGGAGDRPSELILRFLPLLSEALRSKLRPGDDEPAPEVGAEVQEGEQETVDENAQF